VTLRGKLGFGFGTLIALVALFSGAVLFDLDAVERELYEQSEVARPRSAAARQMEINLLGYALAVRSFLHVREQRFLEEAKREAQDLDVSVREYTMLARTVRQGQLAARFQELWHEYKRFADGQTSQTGASHAESQQLIAMRVALENLVDAEIQVEARQTYDETKTATAARLSGVKRLAAFVLIASLIIGAAVAVGLSRVVSRAQPGKADGRNV
jgi:CHASE3 domain sensor protein